MNKHTIYEYLPDEIKTQTMANVLYYAVGKKLEALEDIGVAPLPVFRKVLRKILSGIDEVSHARSSYECGILRDEAKRRGWHEIERNLTWHSLDVVRQMKTLLTTEEWADIDRKTQEMMDEQRTSTKRIKNRTIGMIAKILAEKRELADAVRRSLSDEGMEETQPNTNIPRSRLRKAAEAGKTIHSVNQQARADTGVPKRKKKETKILRKL